MIQEQCFTDNYLYVRLSNGKSCTVSREELRQIYLKHQDKPVWQRKIAAWHQLASMLGLPEEFLVVDIDWEKGVVSTFGYRE